MYRLKNNLKETEVYGASMYSRGRWNTTTDLLCKQAESKFQALISN